MEKISNSSSQGRDALTSPFTLDVCRDPVVATNGHVSERDVIVQWMETNHHPRQNFNTDDFRPTECTKQSYEVHPVTYLIESDTTSVSTQSKFNSYNDDYDTQRSICKQNCNIKHVLLVILVVILILVPLVIISSIILSRYRFNSITTNPTRYTKSPRNITYPPTQYYLPNNCTLPRIESLFLWDNVPSFNWRFYSKTYIAISDQTIITFAFRHAPSYWYLDNVSVIDTSSDEELIINGHFENNPSDGFIRCNAFGNTSTTSFMSPPFTHTVQSWFYDGSVDLPDYLSQTLNTKIGQEYQISFWLQNQGNAPNGAQVVMSS